MKTFRMLLLCLMFIIFVDSQMVATINFNRKDDNNPETPVYSLEVPNYFYYKGTDYNLPTIIHERLQISWPRMTFHQMDTNKKIMKQHFYFSNKNKLNDDDAKTKERNELVDLEAKDPTENFNAPLSRPDVSSERREIVETNVHIITPDEKHTDVTTDTLESSLGYTTALADEIVNLTHVDTDQENIQEFSNGYLETSADQRDILKNLSDGTTTNEYSILNTLGRHIKIESKDDFESFNFHTATDENISENDRIQITTEQGNTFPRKSSYEDGTSEHGNVVESSYWEETSENGNIVELSYENGNIVESSYRDETTKHGNIVESSYIDKTEEGNALKSMATDITVKTNSLESSSGYVTTSANEGDVLKTLGSDTKIMFKFSHVDTATKDSFTDFSDDILMFSSDSTIDHGFFLKCINADKITEDGNTSEFLCGDETSGRDNERETSGMKVITGLDDASESSNSYTATSSDEKKIMISSGVVSTTKGKNISEYLDFDLATVRDYRRIQTSTEQTNIPVFLDGNTTGGGIITFEPSNRDLKTEPNPWTGQKTSSVYVKNDQKSLFFVSTLTTPEQENILKSSSEATIEQGSVVELITESVSILQSGGGVTINPDVTNDQRTTLESTSGDMTTSASEEDILKHLDDITTELTEHKDILGSFSDHIALVQGNIQDYIRADITTEKENFLISSSGRIANVQETFEISEADVTTEEYKILETSDTMSVDGQNSTKALDLDQANILKLLIGDTTTEQRREESFGNVNETEKNNILEIFRTQIMTEQRNILESLGAEIETEQMNKHKSSRDNTMSKDDEGDSQKSSISDSTIEKAISTLKSLRGVANIEQENIVRTSHGDELDFIRTQTITTERSNILEALRTKQWIMLESSDEVVTMPFDDKKKILEFSDGEEILKSSSDDTTEQANILNFPFGNLTTEQENILDLPYSYITTKQSNLLDFLHDSITIKQENKFWSPSSDIQTFGTQKIIEGNSPEFSEAEITSEQSYSHKFPGDNLATLDDKGDFMKFSSGSQVDGDVKTELAYILESDGVKDEQINIFEFSEAEVQTTQVNTSLRVHGTLNHESEPKENIKQMSKELSKRNQVADQSKEIEYLGINMMEKQINGHRSSKLKKVERSTDKRNTFNPLHSTHAKSTNYVEEDDNLKSPDFLIEDTHQVIKTLNILTEPVVKLTKKIASVNMTLFEKIKTLEIPNLLVDMVHEVFSSKLKLFVKTKQRESQQKDLSENKKIIP